MTTNATARKQTPLATGLLDYFPKALCEVANLSYMANEQHNAGEPMHWSREKSSDHADCLMRHMIERGLIDTDGIRHAAKIAWRALAILELEIEDSEKRDRAVGEVVAESERLGLYDEMRADLERKTKKQ